MEDKLIDKQLNIKTIGFRDWTEAKTQNNRYEGTPYRALDSLLKNYEIGEKDKFLDFGSGRGRVIFYIHNKFKPKMIGIEAHNITYEEAMENKARYMKKSKSKDISIEFKHILAESYEIEEDTNIFYFFNPFSIKIFRKVVENILESFEKNNRTIDMILYYPFPEYRNFIEMKTPFKTYKSIKVEGGIGKLEEFLIYRVE